MNIGAVLIGIAGMVLIALALVDPWVRNRTRLKNDPGARSDGIENKSKELLFALRDLDFDYQTDKISESDYASLRKTILAETADSLLASDESRQRAEAQLERAVRARRKATANSVTCPECGEPVERGHRFCSQCGHALDSSCQKCGSPIQSQDSFCTSCGSPNHVQVGEAA